MLLAAVAVQLAACGGDPAPDTADAAPGTDGTPAALHQVIGGVQVHDTGGAPVWIWEFTEWPSPALLFGVTGEGMWEPTLSAGECVYLDAVPTGFCDPACDSASYCDGDDVCQPWPQRVDAGTMELRGLAADATMVPDENHYYPVVQDLPDVLFTGGETATLTAAGGQVPAFTATTVAPAPLTVDPPCDMPLVAGQELVVTWAPGGGVGRIRWEMITMMHAGNGPMILCETDDTGSLVVAGELITQFLADRTQWPTYQLSRFTRDLVSVGDDRSVALETASTRYCFGTP